MILLALVVCIVISTASFAWGYWQAGYEQAAYWIMGFGIFWLAAHWRKWKWLFALAVFVTLFLAVIGVWYEFTPGLMFNGAAFGVFAWNLNEFYEKLKLLPAREDKKGMTHRYLIRIGLLALSSLFITSLLYFLYKS